MVKPKIKPESPAEPGNYGELQQLTQSMNREVHFAGILWGLLPVVAGVLWYRSGYDFTLPGALPWILGGGIIGVAALCCTGNALVCKWKIKRAPKHRQNGSR